MAEPRFVLSEVTPIFTTSADDTDYADYRRCEWCDWTPCEDVWAGRLDQADWRRYYELLGEDGLICCEQCIPQLTENHA